MSMHLIKFQIPSVTLEEPAGEIGQAMSDKPVRNALIENIFATAGEGHTFQKLKKVVLIK